MSEKKTRPALDELYKRFEALIGEAKTLPGLTPADMLEAAINMTSWVAVNVTVPGAWEEMKGEVLEATRLSLDTHIAAIEKARGESS